jgi:hypothetical protein
MTVNERDVSILERIVWYCGEIDTTRAYFGKSKDVLLGNNIYKTPYPCAYCKSGN